MERILLLRRYNTARCIIALILSVSVIACAFIGIVIQIGDVITIFGHDAFYPFRKFTMLSNLLVLMSVLFGVPFQIEGLRKKNYNAPQWVVCVQFVATVCIFITFVFCAVGAALNLNPEYSLFDRAFLFQHLIVPLLMFVLFLFVNIDCTVPFVFSVVTAIPIGVYELIYLVQVFLIGAGNGGWTDFYHMSKLPMPYVLVPLCCISLVSLPELLRRLHNMFHKIVLSQGKRFLSSEGAKSAETAVAQLAMIDALDGKDTTELRVPIEVISYMRKRYGSDSSIEMLCGIYIDEFLKNKR